MPRSGQRTEVRFYPVMHLLTGPPGLTRNGGIWKHLKRGLGGVLRPPRLMVQALHFVPYKLSPGAWEDWFPPNRRRNRLSTELVRSYGPRRDIFLDSGGFQLLYGDKIDLSRWGFDLEPESIFRLQTLYGPQRVASLDSPIPPSADAAMVNRLSTVSIRNAVWLAENSTTADSSPLPYLVVHGRTPDEVRSYLDQLETQLPRGWLRSREYGLALGSQVPLSGSPELVVSNIRAVLGWMEQHSSDDVPLHIFGVGDGILGQASRQIKGPARLLSYDNSTYVQKAFRLKIFDPSSSAYVDVDPTRTPECSCAACRVLTDLGSDAITEVLSSPPYAKHAFKGVSWNKSDLLALFALHNLRWWRTRLATRPHHYKVDFVQSEARASTRHTMGYRFPLPRFEPIARRLLMLPCSKWRPYSESRSQTKVSEYLASQRLHELEDYDRITLSGLYGPVHWMDERDPAILNYDFPLTQAVSDGHLRRLRVRTASVLSVIARRYDSSVAYLRTNEYARVFGPVLTSFGVRVTGELSELPNLLRAYN